MQVAVLTLAFDFIYLLKRFFLLFVCLFPTAAVGGFYRYDIYPIGISQAWESSRHSLQHRKKHFDVNVFYYSEKLILSHHANEVLCCLNKQKSPWRISYILHSRVLLLVGISQERWGFLQNISMNLIIKSTRDVRKVTKIKYFNSKVFKCNLTCQRCSWRKSGRSSAKQGRVLLQHRKV